MGTAIAVPVLLSLMAGVGRNAERMFCASVHQRPLWADLTFAGASLGDAGTASPGDAGNVVSNNNNTSFTTTSTSSALLE